MPPISVVTDEISQDLAECDRFLRDNVVDAVELRTISGRRVPELSPADRAALGRWIDDGRRVIAVSPGTFKCDVAERDEIGRQLTEVLPRAVELASELGAPFVITFGFDNPSGAPAPRYALDVLYTAADVCAEAGIGLLLENEPGFLASTGAATRALIDAVGHANLAANWDPLNGNELEREALERSLRALYPHVRHVHVKNGRLRAGERFARCCSLIDGDIDWPAHLALLAELGYTGHLGIETHYEPLHETTPRVLAELRAMLAAPA